MLDNLLPYSLDPFGRRRCRFTTTVSLFKVAEDELSQRCDAFRQRPGTCPAKVFQLLESQGALGDRVTKLLSVTSTGWVMADATKTAAVIQVMARGHGFGQHAYSPRRQIDSPNDISTSAGGGAHRRTFESMRTSVCVNKS